MIWKNMILICNFDLTSYSIQKLNVYNGEAQIFTRFLKSACRKYRTWHNLKSHFPVYRRPNFWTMGVKPPRFIEKPPECEKWLFSWLFSLFGALLKPFPSFRWVSGPLRTDLTHKISWKKLTNDQMNTLECVVKRRNCLNRPGLSRNHQNGKNDFFHDFWAFL